MAILNKIYPFLFLLLLAGCYEDFTLDIDTKPVLCLNSLITAGEPIDVKVTHTWLYTDEEASFNHEVDDAVVHIYVNGEPVGEDYIPQEKDRIRIVAESATYGVAEAEVTVPESVPIDTVEWKADITDIWRSDNSTLWTGLDNEDEIGGDRDDYTLHLMTVYFDFCASVVIKDPLEAVNYYQFSYSSFPKDESTDEVTVFQSLTFYPGTFHSWEEPIFSEHMGSFEIMSGNGNYGFTFFSDRQFSGKSYALKTLFEKAHCTIRSEDLAEVPEDFGYELTLATVSPSYYNWCSYRWNSEEGSLNDLSDVGLADPVWGYSNVSTGAGVVAARSLFTRRVNLRDFLQQVISNMQK